MNALILAMAVSAIASDHGIADPPPSVEGHAESPLPPAYLIGEEKQHRIAPKETLLDIARNYHLGFNELADLYPQLDPWIPPPGMMLRIPSCWIPPDTQVTGIVVNIAELRLYLFDHQKQAILTFPISIGDPKAPTPEGSFSIKTKTTRPTWSVPPSLTHKYAFSTLPPGPRNPLGDYWLGIESHYGIHGTDFPWSIGRAVTNGCMRLYPEDIAHLFPLVSPGMPVKIIYEPIKFALLKNHVVVEVHPDVYGKFEDFNQYGIQLLRQKRRLAALVSISKYFRALERKSGALVDVTLLPD